MNFNDFNDQHTWGGQPYQPEVLSSVTTMTGHERQNDGFRPFPQAGFVASTSDDFFHPTVGGPSSHIYTLPDIPHNPHPHYQNQRSLPHPSVFTSYNNPSFTIPPPAHALYTHASPLTPVPLIPDPVVNLPDQPPPIPYHSKPQPQLPHPYYPHNAAYNQFFPNQPINYIPALQNSVSPLSPTLSDISSHRQNLPNVSHISLLTSKSDFPAWDEGVTTLIRANGLIGHILDPLAPVDISRPDLILSPVPTLPVYPSNIEIAALNRWWDEDNIAQHILLSRLGAIPRGLLPAPNIVTRTALSIYRLLLEYYGTCNYADCTLLLNSLQNSTCTTGRVQEFVSKWRTGISRLQSAKFIFNIKICIGLFVRGLPSIPAFNTIRAELPERIAAIPHEQDYGAFITLTEKVLQLDTIFCSISQSHVPRQARDSTGTMTSVPQATGTNTPKSPNAPDTTPRIQKHCNNCKSRGLRSVGHTDDTCFQQGGGMEGRREEYLSNRGRVHAMFAECLENALLSPDQLLPSDISSPPSSPHSFGPPTLDDEQIIPPIANLCIVSPTQNADLRDDLYKPDLIKFTFPLACVSIDFTSASLASMVSQYNALLDSGCTHHIIRNRSLFHSYSDKSISVGTANC